MKRMQWLGVLLVLGLFVPACSSTTRIGSITEGASTSDRGAASESTIDPDWHLTLEQIELGSTSWDEQVADSVEVDPVYSEAWEALTAEGATSSATTSPAASAVASTEQGHPRDAHSQALHHESDVLDAPVPEPSAAAPYGQDAETPSDAAVGDSSSDASENAEESSPSAAVEQSVAPNKDLTVYFMRIGLGDRGQEVRDLYALAVQTGKVTQLTSQRRLINIDRSPDGRTVAFTSAEDVLLEGALYLTNPGGSGKRRIGTVDALAPIVWTPDGSAVAHAYFTDTGEMGVRQTSLADGSMSVLMEPSERSVYPIGYSGNDLIYMEDTGFIAKYSFADGRVDSVRVGEGLASLSDDGTLAAMTSDPGYMTLVDVTAQPMTASQLPTGPGSARVPFVSPDSRFVSYVVQPGSTDQEVYVIDLAAPDTRIHLSAGIDMEFLSRPIWSPDSQLLVFSVAEAEGEHGSIHLVSLDGVVTDLGVDGYPMMVVQN